MLPVSSGLLFGFIAITCHAFVVMFMHQVVPPPPAQGAAATKAAAWSSASRKAESRLSRKTMDVPSPIARRTDALDESAYAREREDFAALRKDMRQLINRLSQHLDVVESPRSAAVETPVAGPRTRPS